MRINHNIAALNTYRQLSSNQSTTSKSLEKLSSGLRINRAGDDAAGLAISEKMRGQIRGLDQASRNASDGISLIQTAEGALNETHSILQRMRELAVQSSNDTTTDADRQNLQEEANQLAQEVTRIANTTEFNKKTLMGESSQFSGTFLIGANAGQSIDLTIGAMDADTLGVGTAAAGPAAVGEIATVSGNGNEFVAGGVDLTNYTQSKDLDIKIEITTAGVDTTSQAVANITINGVTKSITSSGGVATAGAAPEFTLGAADFSDIFESGQSIVISGGNSPIVGDEVNISITGASSTITGIDINDRTAAENSLSTIDTAINTVSSERSKLGAVQNRLEHTINNLGTSSENLTAAESRIRDVDMAKEMMDFTKNNILSQAAQAMLAQANQQPQGVLQLLQ